MATQTITADVRRTDLRANVFETPYWITSANMGIVKGQCVLFSFPTAGEIIWIHHVVCQVTTNYSAGSTIDIGTHTLATDAITTAGVLTTVDDDEFIGNADITATTAAYYGSTTANKSDWLTAIITGTYAAPNILVGAATTVPCVTALIANAGALTAGAARVHMLISRIPGV